VPTANAAYLTNAGDPAPCNENKATELFNAPGNDPASPNDVRGGTTIG
jgi:hypothetical protein